MVAIILKDCPKHKSSCQGNFTLSGLNLEVMLSLCLREDKS